MPLPADHWTPVSKEGGEAGSGRRRRVRRVERRRSGSAREEGRGVVLALRPPHTWDRGRGGVRRTERWRGGRAWLGLRGAERRAVRPGKNRVLRLPYSDCQSVNLNVSMLRELRSVRADAAPVARSSPRVAPPTHLRPSSTRCAIGWPRSLLHRPAVDARRARAVDQHHHRRRRTVSSTCACARLAAGRALAAANASPCSATTRRCASALRLAAAIGAATDGLMADPARLLALARDADAGVDRLS